MIEGHEWVRICLITIGGMGLGICVSRLLRKVWPPDEDDD